MFLLATSDFYLRLRMASIFDHNVQETHIRGAQLEGFATITVLNNCATLQAFGESFAKCTIWILATHKDWPT
jgi:hypothetical protein